MQKDTLKGYFYTILATLAFSNVYVFSKAALNEISLPLFLFLICLFGFVINLVILIVKRGFVTLSEFPEKCGGSFPP